ncbi:fluoride efflux transporter CrcB [Nocardioides mangrovi]|uniref:Fluoride-specific ion channel FluC n=1 Tax=Nocardioides mangrovi TaxID=2874580 RepID=A0ABS7UC88_9ACTN|nr:fluoride efflux transporter CrcB [Nocardioides mangrovi]MBZ5738455.1 fluoride efflux transporter CrcB [Nocardioides mangrovi]
MSDRSPLPRLVLAVAIGGSLGALLRWWLTDLFPSDPDDFPWATFAINVTGSFLLALLPALTAVRRSRTLAVGLGPGLLGGYTTLSAYSEQTRALLDHGRTATAGLYLLGTLAACLVAVAIADHWSTLAQRGDFEAEGGDE